MLKSRLELVRDFKKLKKLIAPSRLQLILNLASVWIIWGSTYLFIHFATESMPPLFMSAVRFLIAGAMLYTYARFQGGSVPAVRHWKAAGILGTLLLVIGNAGMGIAIAVFKVPTGLAALLVAMLPIWVAFFNWIGFSRVTPSVRVLAGLLMGLVGLVILISPDKLSAHSPINWFGVLVIAFGSFSWAIATLLAPRLPQHPFQLQASAMQMLFAGGALLIISLVNESITAEKLLHATPRSLVALGYLITFGSLLGFTSYAWLVKNAPPHITTTYAYVNPVVAMFLGWVFAGEKLTGQSLLAAAIIIAGVVLITTQRKAKKETVRAEVS